MSAKQMQDAKLIVAAIKSHYYWMSTLHGIALHRHNHVLPIIPKLLNIPECFDTMAQIIVYQTGLVYNYLADHPYEQGFEEGFLQTNVNSYPI